jgi:hypothetical protein
MLMAAVIRHGLTALSVWLVSQHMLTAEHSADFVTNLTNYAVDAIPVIVSLLWSAVQKSDVHDEIQQGAAISTVLAPVVAPPPQVIVVTTPPAPEPTKE